MSCMDLIPSPLPETLRFPLGDDSRRGLDGYLDRLAEEHPDIAEPLKNFREDKSSKKKRTDDCSPDHNTPSGDSTPTHTEKEIHKTQPEESSKEKRGLDAKLRYTVPDMRREQEEEQDRVGRSQSAPPSQQNPVDSQPNHGQQAPPTREPVVRHIPIFVEGRDEPVIPKDFVDSPYPREKRNLSRETSPVPPARRTVPEHHARPQEQPTSIHVEHPQQAKHTSSVHINHSGPHPQDRNVPVDVKINTEQTQPPRQQAQSQSQQQPPPKQSSQSKLILGPLEKVHAVQEEVDSLKEKVEQYAGASRKDKEYVYLDEMLTRNLLKLDDIETEGKEDVRAARKEAIRQIQRCISHLEAKAPLTGGSKNEIHGDDAAISETDKTEEQDNTDNQKDSTSPENQTNEAQSSQTDSQNQPSPS